MSEEKTTQEIKLYELGYHLVPFISEDQVPAKVEELKKLLSKNNSEIVKEGEPKMMDLSYEITKSLSGKNQRFNNAYFGWIKFNTTAEAIEAIKEEIDSMEDVLRSLIVKTVDDDEHSTSKISNESEEKENSSKEDNEEAEKPKDEVVEDKEEKEEVSEDKGDEEEAAEDEGESK